MAKGYWHNATTYRFNMTGSSLVTNMKPWNCHKLTVLKRDTLMSYVNVTNVFEKEEISMSEEEEPMPTESSSAKCIPFALDPKFQQPCRYGFACTRPGCLYQHPTDMPTESAKLVDADVYVSLIDRKTSREFMMEIACKYGKVLRIAMPNKDVAGNYISKRSDGRYTCNVHFLGVESAMEFIDFINGENNTPVLKKMNAVLNGEPKLICLPATSCTPFTGNIDWRESLRNKSARMSDKSASPQPVCLTPPVRRSLAVKIINPETQIEIDMPSQEAVSQDGQSVLRQSRLLVHSPQPSPMPPPSPSPMPPPPPSPMPQRVRKKVRKEDADGFATIGRYNKVVYTTEDEEEEELCLEENEDELCLEENEDELCLEENEEELCLEENEELCLEENEEASKKQERNTCSTSSSDTSISASPFTMPVRQKLISWYDMTQQQDTKHAFGSRSFASLFKAVDACDAKSEVENAEPTMPQDPQVVPEVLDGIDDDASSVASIDSFTLDMDDDLEDDVVFAKTVAKR